jgi:hypothetical protein
MAPTVEELLGSPDHYLHSFDGDHALFVPMDRAAYRRSIFLDQRISPAGPGVMRVPVAALAEAPPALPINWIFHVAHCGSTLLARALDELGGGLVLREPLALRQLALLPEPGALLAPTLALLSRRYPGAGPTLIKANVPVNFMLPELVKADPQARAVFLYSGLTDYCVAILRSDNHRAWLRGVTALLRGTFAADLPQSDAELAALLWAAQLRLFAGAIAAMPNAVSLEAEAFFARPAQVLDAASAHFGRSIAAGVAEQLVTGPLFKSYSKNPALAFDNTVRLHRNQALANELTDEIAAAQRWLAGNATDVPESLAALSDAALTV